MDPEGDELEMADFLHPWEKLAWAIMWGCAVVLALVGTWWCVVKMLKDGLS